MDVSMESFQMGNTCALLADFYTGENRPMTEQRDGGCLHGVLPDGYDLHIFLEDFYTQKKINR
jgi:hypothetical protein